jgi:cytochrome c oxidase assembly protein subunit 15
MSGACAAGIDAMKVFNDWPYYNGALLPPNILGRDPLWSNFFENKGLVQFNHRNFGYATLLCTIYTIFTSRKLNLRGVQSLAILFVGSTVGLQVFNGILTLIHNTPKHEANVHQLNALLVLTATIYLLHTCRNPTPVYATYLKRFVP